MADEEVIDDVADGSTGEDETSLSDDLASAWEESTGEALDADGGASGDSGDTTSADAGTGGGDLGSAGQAVGEPAAGAGETGAEAVESGPRPPVDWTPELREEWAGLPEGVRTQIANREAQMNQAMQGTAQARRVAQDFTGVANQYGSVMAAEGVQNPVQMFDATMRVVSELRMGTTQQKANRIASMISEYGIDIATLDDALAGQITGEPPAQGGNADLEALLDQRMAPVTDMMQQLAGMQQQKQQASAYEAQQEVDAFSQNAEFLNDVRHDVADLIDMATRQGREMPLQEAYAKACSMNPQISQVLEQRAEQAKIMGGRQTIAGKRNAGSSLRPGNIGSNASGTPQSLHDSISAAWDDQLSG